MTANQINNYCIDSQCSNCGHCCSASGLPVTQKEVMRIVDYVKSNSIHPVNRGWVKEFHENGKLENPVIDARCCFYDHVNRICLIYPVRPSVCKSFQCNLSQEYIESVRENCHRAAYYNRQSGENGNIKRLTNFDMLFYNEMLPLQMLYLKIIDSVQKEEVLSYLYRHVYKYSYKLDY